MKYSFSFNPQPPWPPSLTRRPWNWRDKKKKTSLSLWAIFHTITATWPSPQHVPRPPLWWETRCKLPCHYHRLSASHNDDPLPEKSDLWVQLSRLCCFDFSEVGTLFPFFLLRLSEYFSVLFNPGLTFCLPGENRTGLGCLDLKQSHPNDVIFLQYMVAFDCFVSSVYL